MAREEFKDTQPPDLRESVCTLCKRAEGKLQQLQEKHTLLVQQQAALQQAIDGTSNEIVATRAAVSSYRLALGQPALPNSLPPDISVA